MPEPKLTWRAKARIRAGLEPRTRGGQPGNRNRLKHGRYSRAFLARRAHTRGILCETRALIARLNLAAKLRRALNLPPPSEAWRGLSEAKGAGQSAQALSSQAVKDVRYRQTNATLSRKPALAPPARSLDEWREGKISKTPPFLRAYVRHLGRTDDRY
jgi:hypothetical protein